MVANYKMTILNGQDYEVYGHLGGQTIKKWNTLFNKSLSCPLLLLCLFAQLFGHEKVSVLDGGLERWIADGYETTNMMVKKMVRVINSFD